MAANAVVKDRVQFPCWLHTRGGIDEAMSKASVSMFATSCYDSLTSPAILTKALMPFEQRCLALLPDVA